MADGHDEKRDFGGPARSEEIMKNRINSNQNQRRGIQIRQNRKGRDEQQKTPSLLRIANENITYQISSSHPYLIKSSSKFHHHREHVSFLFPFSQTNSSCINSCNISLLSSSHFLSKLLFRRDKIPLCFSKEKKQKNCTSPLACNDGGR